MRQFFNIQQFCYLLVENFIPLYSRLLVVWQNLWLGNENSLPPSQIPGGRECTSRRETGITRRPGSGIKPKWSPKLLACNLCQFFWGRFNILYSDPQKVTPNKWNIPQKRPVSPKDGNLHIVLSIVASCICALFFLHTSPACHNAMQWVRGGGINLGLGEKHLLPKPLP